MIKLLILLSTLLALSNSCAPSGKNPQTTVSPKTAPVIPFSSALLKHLSTQNAEKNFVLSPFSIKTALTLLYLGAEGKTSEEFHTILKYPSNDKLENIANVTKIMNLRSNGSDVLNISNRIYTSHKLNSTFNDKAIKHFKSEAEMTDFSQPEAVAEKINTWVEKNTNEKIKKLIDPSSIEKDTTAILINAIYFKGEWEVQFNNRSTRQRRFWIDAKESVNVSTMIGEIPCKYGKLEDLDATAIELDFKETALLVILPNERDGLKTLEAKITELDLLELSKNMISVDVIVRLPKFEVEFETGLVPILEEIGMKTAFTSAANYTGIFESDVPVKVSDVAHKAYIKVNEEGSEAAASSYVKLTFLSGPINDEPIIFNADHPFIFAIKDNEAVYFLGHIVRP